MRYGLEEARKKILQTISRETASGVAPNSFPVVLRIKIPVIDIDPLQWLSGQKSLSKIFWRSASEDLAVAGSGVAFQASAEGWYGFDDVWKRVSEVISASSEIRFFSGMSFARTISGKEWAGFPAIRFVLPALEMIKDKDGCWLAVNLVRGADGSPFGMEAKSELERMRFIERVSHEEALALSREDVPDYEDWSCSAEAVTDSLEKEGLEKAVLARRVTLLLEKQIPPENFLSVLGDARRADFTFLFSYDGATFLGTTSESLYLREGDRVHGKTIAGSQPRGKNKAQDEAFRKALLKSDKALKEHRMVAGALVEVFRELCRSYQVDCSHGEIDVLCLPSQQHLLMNISGVLSEGVTDKEFLQALYPAPAVCGVPAEKARLFLQQYEVFERGWFCGPVGCFNKSRTEIAVASRACLLEGDRLHAYALSAFTSGADPFSRWEDAAREMRNILNVVHGIRL